MCADHDSHGITGSSAIERVHATAQPDQRGGEPVVMAKLIQQAQGRLTRAGDASRDPADLSASTEADDSRIDSESEGTTASISASDKAINEDDQSASVADDNSANMSGSTIVSSMASTAEVAPASGSASAKADRKTSGKTGRASTKKASTSTKRGRRVGRPAGPARTPLTVRVRVEIDEALTDAVDGTGLSPQYIADEALSAWLVERGYLTGND